jgi:hypothetical protein
VPRFDWKEPVPSSPDTENAFAIAALAKLIERRRTAPTVDVPTPRWIWMCPRVREAAEVREVDGRLLGIAERTPSSVMFTRVWLMPRSVKYE